ncbi:MAG: nucleotidyl transferase AbiEii/AbiGii toxin family protein [Pyrinomonadaceae bacterium]
MIDLFPDFHDILIELADAEVDFVLVGAFALAFHGHPRATKDIDIFVRATDANAQKLYLALAKFGAPLSQFDTTEKDFAESGNVLQIGVPPRRIDIINSVTGITFDDALEESLGFQLDGRHIKVVGFAALVKNKRAAGRPQDVADVKALTDPRRAGRKT